ncbi:aspartyl protease family protein [Anatilimnocola sp. NA78]|uniref:aspartyl protease family protein n=1 Tax=Anatilimnocola sp. NA78 TaxID=3415683 RepID=UPI003CE55F03
MEPVEMGRVVVPIIVENLGDLWDAENGRIAASEVRRIEIKDALVDTGSTTLALPTSTIALLGLRKRTEKNAITSGGKRTINVYGAVRVTILGRDCTVDVMEVPDDVPALIGQIPLEMLDLVVDSRNRRLTGNPAHNGEHVLELL